MTSEPQFPGDGEMPPAETIVPVSLDVAAIVLEGMQRMDDWRRIREAIPSFAAVPVRVVAEPVSARAVQAARVPPALVEKLLVRVGRSFHEIATAARSRKADLIIISTHGYTGVKHALLGSTTERVVRHAPCPVLVVRQRR